MGLKLCDSLYYNTDPIYAYSDADILFFKPFDNLFSLPDAATNALFMHDAWDNCYSFRSWHLMMSPQVKLPLRVNAGLTCLRKTAYDPDYMEWFLSNPRHMGNRHNGLPEQTAWAALGLRVGCRKWNPAQVTVMLPDTPVQDLVVGHFTFFTRHLLNGYAEQAAMTRAQQPVTKITTVPPGRCTPATLFYTESKRIGSRIVKKLLKRSG